MISTSDLAAPLAGFIVVLASLTAIWLLLEVQGAFFRWLARYQARRAEAREAAEQERQQVALAAAAMHVAEYGDGGADDELVAVITAAAYAALGTPGRVLSIRPARSHGSDAWSSEGRRSIYSSHRVR